MKYLLSFITSTFCLFINAQEIFKYEKKADSIEVYKHTEISFYNEIDKIKLSGTIIEPDSYQKIAIIIPGSGKDTRHSHYILTENLLDNGVAVFRFDERGTGKSGGSYSELAGDLSRDMISGYNYLRDSHTDKEIGFIGHSLGGIAALQAVRAGARPDFMVLIETPVVKNGDFVLNQIKSDYSNSIPEIMRDGKTEDEVLNFLKSYFHVISTDSLSMSGIKKFIAKSGFNKRFIALLNDKFLIEMLHTDLEEIARDVTIPTLYLTGTKDKVINHAKETELVKSFGNNNIQIVIFDGLNHWLTKKNATVGTSLYAMDGAALEAIIRWMN